MKDGMDFPECEELKGVVVCFDISDRQDCTGKTIYKGDKEVSFDENVNTIIWDAKEKPESAWDGEEKNCPK